MDDPLVPEFLETYRDESGQPEQRVMVFDLRTCFPLEEETAPIMSGFLRETPP